jgi:4-hydroxybenzoate polyprenyltransferase
MLKHIVTSLRPKQWTKNLVIFAGLVFSASLFNVPSLLTAMAAFAVFCLLSSAVYLINDICDVERDRIHPVKCKRPIAAGLLSPRVATITAALILVVALSAAWALDRGFFIVCLVYLLLFLSYSLYLKNIVILDVLLIAVGFVLRAIAGAVVIDVRISAWLLVCTILLALFLGLCKRRDELVKLADAATGHRQILDEYSPYLLDQMIAVVTASTLMAYALYTMADETIQKFDTAQLHLTIPFVIYGIFRYLYLIHRKEQGGNPSLTLLTDRPLLINILLWTTTVILIIYWSRLAHIF